VSRRPASDLHAKPHNSIAYDFNLFIFDGCYHPRRHLTNPKSQGVRRIHPIRECQRRFLHHWREYRTIEDTLPADTILGRGTAGWDDCGAKSGGTGLAVRFILRSAQPFVKYGRIALRKLRSCPRKLDRSRLGRSMTSNLNMALLSFSGLSYAHCRAPQRWCQSVVTRYKVGE
jgi:hypothetical protein